MPPSCSFKSPCHVQIASASSPSHGLYKTPSCKNPPNLTLKPTIKGSDDLTYLIATNKKLCLFETFYLNEISVQYMILLMIYQVYFKQNIYCEFYANISKCNDSLNYFLFDV